MKHIIWRSRRAGLTAGVAFFFLVLVCHGQGTTTFTFEGPPYVGGPSPQPPGTYTTISSYSESGMRFWNPYGLENLATIGAGLAGAPNNGTAHLDITGRAKLGFGFNTFPGTYFNLVSFDAADYDISFPGTTLEVVGYKGMIGTVTNYFTLDSLASRRANGLPDFQTFYLDSQFQNVFRVDVLTDRWALDNLVISHVPEPSACALLLLGIVCCYGRKWMKDRRMPGTPVVRIGVFPEHKHSIRGNFCNIDRCTVEKRKRCQSVILPCPQPRLGGISLLSGLAVPVKQVAEVASAAHRQAPRQPSHCDGGLGSQASSQ